GVGSARTLRLPAGRQRDFGVAVVEAGEAQAGESAQRQLAPEQGADAERIGEDRLVEAATVHFRTSSSARFSVSGSSSISQCETAGTVRCLTPGRWHAMRGFAVPSASIANLGPANCRGDATATIAARRAAKAGTSIRATALSPC